MARKRFKIGNRFSVVIIIIGCLTGAEEDDTVVLHRWTRMWLCSLRTEALMRLQVGHEIPFVRTEVEATVCRRSRAAARRWWRSFSRAFTAFLVRARQPRLSKIVHAKTMSTVFRFTSKPHCDTKVFLCY